MTGNPDEQRRSARAWRGTAEGDAALLAEGRLLEALELERQATSVEARKAAQQDALQARADLDEALGVTGLLRRRMLAASRGEPPGTAADERDFGKLTSARTRNTRAGRAALRHASGRYLIDNAPALGMDLALWLAGQGRRANNGFKGLLSPEPVAGADPDGGDAHDLRGGTIQRAGYSVEQLFDGGTIPRQFWTQAAKAHNAAASRLRAKGAKVKPVSPNTIKDWCLREGEGREQFEMARADSRKDRAARRTDRKRML